MSIPGFHESLLLAQGLSAFYAIEAAFYWWQSAKVRTPGSFDIMVVKPSGGILGGLMDGEYMGQGYSQELSELGAALSDQSRISAQAAQCAAVAAGLQAYAAVITPFS